jgi:pectate lyase
MPDAGAVDAGITVGIAIEGFGAGTLGGWQAGYSTYVVTNLNDDGPGSLREGTRTQNTPRVITFAVDGRIALTTPIDLPSNVTIDGRGHDVGVTGKGFWVHGQSHVILTHFAIENVGPNSEDGIQIGVPNVPVAHHVVLDHMLFSQTGNGGDSANVDEAISVIFGAHDVTVAWSHFRNWEKVLLAGNGDADASIDGQIAVTLHHNWFENTGRRHPRARFGRFDVFNNFIDHWHSYDWFYLAPYRDSYGSWCQSNCQMRVESNAYERVSGSKDFGTNADDASRCTEGGAIAESGAYVTPSSTATLHFSNGCSAAAPVFARPYAATVETANAALVTKLKAQTGN